MESDPWAPAESLEIRDLETLKVMADAQRMQLIDLLRRDAATVKELAAALHVSPKSLYYHVNLLEQHGLIRVVEIRLVSGILEKRYRATAYLFTFSEVTCGPESTLPSRVIESVASVFAMTRDAIRIGLENGTIDPADSAPAAARLSFEWNLFTLSPARRTELEERLQAVVAEYTSDDPGCADAQTYRYLSALFPTYRRGERPDLPTPDTAGGPRP